MNGALRALLSERIDYAGLFPPASLSMAEAVANYAAYRDGADAWALGRFVVPVVRLDEFEEEAAPHLRAAPWRLSVLAQAIDTDAVRGFNTRMAGRVRIDALESRIASERDIAELAPLASFVTVYVELPVRDDPEPLIERLGAHGLRAKIRCGGVTTDAFPSADEVARFLAACARHQVPFKATAGLHHPMRGEYPLTYATGAVRGLMFGYLNVLLAASLARRGCSAADLVPLLEERELGAFRLYDGGLSWRTQSFTAAELAGDRANFAVSFGSCSFREPLDDLLSLVSS